MLSTSPPRRRHRPHPATLTAVAGAAAAFLLAACGGAAYGTGGSAASSASTAASSASSSGGAAAAPQLAVAAAQTKAGMVLVGASGNTVYTLLSAQGTPLPCSGSCSSLWPPVTVATGTEPTDGTGVSATLGTTARADGSLQLTAGGLPLYYFVRDTAAGQANGEGLHGFGGTWYAVTTDGQPAGAATTPTPVMGY